MPTEFTPTAEQAHAVELFRTGENLAIQAGAGTGKTSTLKLLAAAAAGGRGQYVAFNKAIVTDASASMPANVHCATAHSLAYKGFGNRYGRRLRNSRRMRSNDIAKFLRIDPLVVAYGEQRKPMAAGYLAGQVMTAITNFCQSADLDPNARHLPYIDGIDVPTAKGERTYDNNNMVRNHLVDALRRAWADLLDPNGQLPYKHDHYLKGWHLSGPRIDADFILFDEAQDANPVLIDIVRRQEHAQQVFVGDSQQQIYEFTGAVNALDRIAEGGGQVAYLSQSFRFGPKVANVANGLLGRLSSPLHLVGAGPASIVGPVSNPDCFLTRTNARAVREVLATQATDGKAHLVGGGAQVAGFARAASDLKAGRWTSHPDLACFSDWGQVQDYVENDPQGSELKLLVGLVDEFTPETIIEALDHMVPEKDADVVVSTAHKSKGREWAAVKLADDFFAPREGEDDVAASELRLMYVACTRAKLALDVTLCPQALAAPEPAQPSIPSLMAELVADLDDAKAMTLRYTTRATQ